MELRTATFTLRIAPVARLRSQTAQTHSFAGSVDLVTTGEPRSNRTKRPDMTTPPLSDTAAQQLPNPESQEALTQLLARRELELAAAMRMSEVFSQEIKLQDLLEQSLHIALDVVNAENGSVLLADTDNRTLVFFHSIGEKPVPQGTAVPWYEGIAGMVYRREYLKSSLTHRPITAISRKSMKRLAP